jgi:hypothetical protein
MSVSGQVDKDDKSVGMKACFATGPFGEVLRSR